MSATYYLWIPLSRVDIISKDLDRTKWEATSLRNNSLNGDIFLTNQSNWIIPILVAFHTVMEVGILLLRSCIFLPFRVIFRQFYLNKTSQSTKKDRKEIFYLLF